MMRRLIAATAAVSLIICVSESKAKEFTPQDRHSAYGYSPFVTAWLGEARKPRSYRKARHVKRSRSVRVAKAVPARLSPAVASAPVPVKAAGQVIEAVSETIKTPFGVVIKTVVSLAGISPRLTAFVRRVSEHCGPVKIISGVRNSGVPGTCHRTGNALDYQIADFACALRVARGQRVGHSTDYLGVRRLSPGMPAHYHVSDCPREMGARFAHGGGRYAKTRYAKRMKRGVRYATAG